MGAEALESQPLGVAPLQTVQAAGGEPAPPLADRIDADAQPGGDPGIRVPAAGVSHLSLAGPLPAVADPWLLGCRCQGRGLPSPSWAMSRK